MHLIAHIEYLRSQEAWCDYFTTRPDQYNKRTTYFLRTSSIKSNVKCIFYLCSQQHCCCFFFSYPTTWTDNLRNMFDVSRKTLGTQIHTHIHDTSSPSVIRFQLHFTVLTAEPKQPFLFAMCHSKVFCLHDSKQRQPCMSCYNTQKQCLLWRALWEGFVNKTNKILVLLPLAAWCYLKQIMITVPDHTWVYFWNYPSLFLIWINQ